MRTDSSSTARVQCIITATTTGPWTVRDANGIVSTAKHPLWFTQSNNSFPPFPQPRPSQHPAVSISLVCMPSPRSAPLRTSSAPMVSHTNRTAMPVWPTMSAFMAATGPISYSITAIPRVSYLHIFIVIIYIYSFVLPLQLSSASSAPPRWIPIRWPLASGPSHASPFRATATA